LHWRAVLRIAFDYQIFILAHGGIPRYFNQLANGLLDLKQKIRIFSPFYQNSSLRNQKNGIVCGRYMQRYPPKSARIFLAFNKYVARHKISRWKPDVVHETYYAKQGSAPKRCPTVITVHDMIHELFKDNYPKNDGTVLRKKTAVGRADHIICVSENTKKDLMQLYDVSVKKVSVVHHGFEQFVPKLKPVPYVTKSGRPFILYVGVREGYKNFLGLLKSVASSSRLLSDFDIVAFGGGKFSVDELEEISVLGFLEDQVIQKSGDDDLLGSLYSTARSFVYPSLYEGFGIPPLEAMANQCPVISSKTSSMPEVIGEAAEYFDPTDTDDMKRAIENVVYSDSYIKKLQQSGKERLTFFSWNKCSRETLNIYKKVIS